VTCALPHLFDNARIHCVTLRQDCAGFFEDTVARPNGGFCVHRRHVVRRRLKTLPPLRTFMIFASSSPAATTPSSTLPSK
jgi:hypothetical protein